MATLGSLGDLVLALSADTAKFQSDLGRAHREAEKFGRDVGIVIGKLAGAFLALGGSAGFGALVKGQIDAADQAGKMSQKIGVGVEQLSAYMVAAQLADVSNDHLKIGFKELAKNQSAFVKGTGEAVQAFQALGISREQVKALNGDTAKLFDLIAGKMAKFEDGANKTAIALKIFGRSGHELIPLINDLERTKGEAAALNAIIDSKTAAAAERFNDNLTRMGIVVRSMALSVAKELLPAMEKMTARMVEGAKSGEPWLAFLREELRLVLAIAQYIPLIGPVARAASAALDSSTKSAKGFQAEVRAIDNALDRKPAPLLRNLAKEAKDAEERLKAAAKGAQAFSDAFVGPVVQAAEETQNAADDMIYTWDAAGERVAMTRAAYEKLGEEQAKVIASFVESAQLSQEAAEGMVYTWDAAGNRIEMTRDAFDELANQQKKNIDFANTLGFTFTSAFEDAVLKGGDLRDVLKGLEQDIARIILRKTVSEPLANAIGAGLTSIFGGTGPQQLSGPGVPAYAEGTDYVPRTGLALVHQGERIIPAGENGPGGGITIIQTLHVDSRSDQASITMAMRRAKDDAVAEIRRLQQRRGEDRV